MQISFDKLPDNAQADIITHYDSDRGMLLLTMELPNGVKWIEIDIPAARTGELETFLELANFSFSKDDE